MSKNMEEWLGVALDKNAPVRDKPTLFPLTFHAYDFTSAPQRDENEQPQPPRFDIPVCYASQPVFSAHLAIIQDRQSPYKAWLGTTYNGDGNFHAMTGLSRDWCDYLLNRSSSADERHYYSPAEEHILKFCKATGVHPAHLEPGLTHADYAYDPQVIRTMFLILKDQESTEYDRTLCLKAFKAEFARYEKFCKDRPYAARLLRKALLALAMEESENRNPPAFLANCFRYASGFGSADISEVLEQHKRNFYTEIRKVKDAFYGMVESHNKISQIALLFCGRERSTDYLDNLVKICRRSFENGRPMTVDEIACEVAIDIDGRHIERMVSSYSGANRSGFRSGLYRARETLAPLLRFYLEQSVNYLNLYAQKNIDCEDAMGFDEWEKEPQAFKADIDLYRNFLLITPHIRHSVQAASAANSLAASSQHQESLSY